MIRTKALVETSLLAALAASLYLAGNILPVAGVILIFVCPAPLVVLGLRQNLRRAVLGSLVASLIVAMVLGLSGALFFFFGSAVVGIGIGGLARRFQGSTEILMYGLLLSIASKLALMGAVVSLTGVNPFHVDPEQIRVTMETAFSSLGNNVTEELRKQMEATLRLLPLLFPALIVMAAAVDCYVSYCVGMIVLKRLGGTRLPPLLPFAAWRFPQSLFWAFLASFLFLWLGSEEGRSPGVLYQAGLNLQILLSMLFFLQGCAVSMAFLLSRGVGKWRWGILALTMFIPLLYQLALLVGVLDIWLDLRVRFGFMPKEPEEESR